MIHLLRHGDAESGNGDDAARRLTEKGASQARDAGAALAAVAPPIEACIASPKQRATETARLAAEPLGVAVEVSEALRGGRFDALELAAGRDEVLLVGHEPDLSDEIARITGARVKLRKGGLAMIDAGTLHALLRPAELRLIAAS